MMNPSKRSYCWLAVGGVAMALGLATPLAPAVAEQEEPWLRGEFTVDPYHTFTNFSYDHFGLSTGRGRFDKTEGTIVINEDAKTANVDITIHVDSVNTGVALLDMRLKSEGFFNAQAFPTIRFVAKDFRYTGDTLTEVAGNLTIKDVTKPVTLKIARAACKKERNPTLKYPACGADASLTIMRSEYNVGAFAPLVSDKIDIAITVEALKGKEAIEAQFQPFKR